ncbi:unnamed protein product [Effrenium voratum]|nr:unnamed protein product [Effrenium voratum]
MDAVRRSKTYNLGGTHFNKDWDPKRAPVPFLPPSDMVFDIMFFRHLFNELAKRCGRRYVPLVALRNVSARMVEVMQLGDPMRVNFFGSLAKRQCKWSDLCDELSSEGHPTIVLSTAERIYMTLENDDSCGLAKVWFHLVMTTTMATIMLFIFPHPLEHFCVAAGLEDGAICNLVFKNFCMSVFTVDYLLKLICSYWVRLEVLEPSATHFVQELGQAAQQPFWPRSGMARVWSVAQQPSNVVDLLAIMPWWCDLLYGQLLPAASFLRVFRLTRVCRIFKSARYLDMLQVLGMTLCKSLGMVLIVFMMISLVGLIAGCVFEQVEEGDAFETVLSATYWTFSRLIGMKDTPHRSGRVTTNWGIAVLSVTLTLRGVLWIVPIERIKQIFTKEYQAVIHEKDLHKSVVEDLMAFDEPEDVLYNSSTGYVCAFLRLSTKEGLLQGPLPVPVEQKQASDGRVTMQLGKQEVQVRVQWQPDKAMQDLPLGRLTLSLDTDLRFLDANWEVPVSTFKKEDRSLSQGLKEASFDIAWDGSHAESAGEAYVQQVDHEDFQQQVLSMLHEQQALLLEQQKKMDSQARKLASLEKP